MNDASLASIAINASWKIILDGSAIPVRKVPYLDVNGDRIFDAFDVYSVREMLPGVPDAEPENHLSFLFSASYSLGLSVFNLRTESEVENGTEILEGDLIAIKLIGERAEVISRSMAELVPNENFKFVEGRSDLIQATRTGTLDVAFTPNLSKYGRVALAVGATPELLADRLNELLKPLTCRIMVTENRLRPSATDVSYSIQQLVGLKTVREINELLAEPQALALKVNADEGLLQNHASEGFKVVVIANPTRGELKVNEDGSFEYSVYKNPLRGSLYEDIKQGDEFTYALTSTQGISEIQKVRIQGMALPILGLSLKTVDANGKEISSVEVGQTFFLEVAANSSNIYRPSPSQFRATFPLQFKYTLDSAAATFVGTPSTPDFFNWERYYLGQEDETLVLKSEVVGPSFTITPQAVTTRIDRFRLDIQKTVLLRQEMLASQVGQINLSIVDSLLEVTDIDFPLISVNGTGLSVTQVSASSTMAFDVSGNGEISPLDVLMIINRLNTTRESSRSTANPSESDACDVNLDRVVSPHDALLVINRLNTISKLGQTDEVGSSKSDPTAIAVDLAFADSEEALRTRTRTKRA